MTVTSIRLYQSKRALLPTPGEWVKPPLPMVQPSVVDKLSAKGVVCMDRSVVEVAGDLQVMVPRLMRVKTDIIRGKLKNSFLEFEPETNEISVCRRNSCPEKIFGNRPVSQVTTFMIRNIPTRFTSISFVRLLEEYGFAGTFNFFYLPMDFRSGKNMGYAFINFHSPETGLRFIDKFHAKRLPVTTSKKVMEISPSRRQGLEDNISLFRTSDLLNSVSLPHYKPLIATPETGGTLVPLSEHNFPQRL